MCVGGEGGRPTDPYTFIKLGPLQTFKNKEDANFRY